MTTPTPVALRCARCEYDLAGLDAAGRCPECGWPIDESIRAAGQWTGRRLRRLRTIAWSLAISASAWVLSVGFPLAMMSLAAGPYRIFACSLALLIVVHVAALGNASIGGIYAGSRHPGSVRVALGAVLGMLLLTAGGCLGLAFLDVRWLQREFESWGFVAMAAVRAINVGAATAWLCVGVAHVSPMATTRRALAIGAAGLVALDWLALGALLVAARFNLVALPWSPSIPAAAATIVDAIAFAVIGAVGFATALSRELREATSAMRVG
ncbi:MAG: hypothetical protein U0572_05910 [Phycisphaerales bacterium]